MNASDDRLDGGGLPETSQRVLVPLQGEHTHIAEISHVFFLGAAANHGHIHQVRVSLETRPRGSEVRGQR